MLSKSEFMGDREEQAELNHHVSEKVRACLCVYVCVCVTMYQLHRKQGLKWRISWGSYNPGAVIISVGRAYFSTSCFFIPSSESSPVHQWVYFVFSHL